jgi:hypothetical protein
MSDEYEDLSRLYRSTAVERAPDQLDAVLAECRRRSPPLTARTFALVAFCFLITLAAVFLPLRMVPAAAGVTPPDELRAMLMEMPVDSDETRRLLAN